MEFPNVEKTAIVDVLVRPCLINNYIDVSAVCLDDIGQRRKEWFGLSRITTKVVACTPMVQPVKSETLLKRLGTASSVSIKISD